MLRPAPTHHPRTESDVADLIRRAAREGRKLRVRGSLHSIPAAIHADRAEDLELCLDGMRAIRIDAAAAQVTVQAGCNLGEDPRDPTKQATWERSLLAALDAAGLALPDLGGVTHQTVAGFLSTGSSGGSVQHAISDAVVALRVVDGNGEAYTVDRRDDRFGGWASSMGLLGVITEVTLQCVPRYDIVGVEEIGPEDAEAPGLFGDGEAGLDGYFRRHEYARLMWWPQEGVRRVVRWQARRMRGEDYGASTGPRGALRARPYNQVGAVPGPERFARAVNLASQAAGGAFYRGLAGAGAVAARLESAGHGAIPAAVRRGFADAVLPRVLRPFVPEGRQPFWDTWHHGLPMDNQMSETSLPTTFTEVWVPLERAGEAMRALRARFDRDGYAATGAYLCEIYAARRTEGWLHPGYGRDSLRLDPFWFERNRTDPADGLFRVFWETLAPFGYRLHWGKHLPKDPARGSAYLRRQYPRWGDFLELRRRSDPHGLFLTRHWRTALGVEP